MPGADPWFESIAANTVLSQPELQALQEDGFVVTRGPVLTTALTDLSRAYDSAVLHADPADVKEGTTTTRVQDFVNRGQRSMAYTCMHHCLRHVAGLSISHSGSAALWHAR